MRPYACSPITAWTLAPRSRRFSSASPLCVNAYALAFFPALDQRISVRYTLTGMTPTETADYINHRLKMAGRADTQK
jgi:hypothetical protein